MLVVVLLWCADGVSEIAMDLGHCYSHQLWLFLLVRGGGSEGTKFNFKRDALRNKQNHVTRSLK